MAVEVWTGKVKWSTSVGTSYKIWHGFGPCLDGKTIVMQTNAGLMCLDRQTGKVLWKVKVKSINESFEPVIWNGMVATQDSKRKDELFLYDRQTGELARTIELGKGMGYYRMGQPENVLAGDALWYLSHDTVIKSVDLSSGLVRVHEVPDKERLMEYDGKAYQFRREGDLIVFYVENGLVRDNDGTVKTPVYEARFNPQTGECVDEVEKKIPQPVTDDRRMKLASVGAGIDDLSITIGDSTVDMPKYGEDSRIWQFRAVSDTRTVVLQKCGEDESILHIVEVVG
jgi:hypothetical protein